MRHPFVLLDDVRPQGGPARLYERPCGTIIARRPEEVLPALQELRCAVAAGCHAAGFLSYEAGYGLDREFKNAPRPAQPPLLWFGLYETVKFLDRAAVAAWLPDPSGAWLGAPTPMVKRDDYLAAVERALSYIRAGDVYQVNLTFPAHVAFRGDPRAAYARLRRAGGGGWGGLVSTGSEWLISVSPEMFFTLDKGCLTARPMKGTAPLSSDPIAFAADPKQRAENLMIVDLLRNDLSQVAIPGSVRVPRLFEVETYPTLRQLTSTITARLLPERDAVHVLESAFPCGSITGAPKIRAMEIIAELEPGPRGPYTGSIGWLDPCGDAAFNVAIRTLVYPPDGSHAVVGLGSGIVADSVPALEWQECLDKAAFIAASIRAAT